MKDLDRLISALVQEAESIDIPYHARQDSLPFSYTSPQSITSQAEKRLQQSQQTSYSTVDSRQPQYSSTSPYSVVPTSADLYGSSSRDTHQNHRGYQSSVEQQILDPQPSTYGHGGLSRSISHQPAATSFNSYDQRSQPASNLLHESTSSNSFNLYGNGTSGVRRMRSQSADGRRDYERGDEDADEWLARQMKKLQEKRASKQTVRTDWLAELKSVLPSERSQTQTDQSSSAMSDFRHTSTSRAETTPVSRANISYSSDEDDDVEMEVFHRGRKIQRHHSESAYDRGYTSSSSTRAPSQQSYTETPFPICPPTPYTNRPVSPGKPPRSPKGIRRYQGASSAPIGAVDIVPLNHMERAQTPVNPRPIFMVDSEVKFAQDISEYWYKPFATREETVAALMQSPCGSFIIRNSNSFPGAYGLAIKVSDMGGEKSIRHFLIEPTRFGVRLRGCGTLEPVFSSLSALVYAHSIECLALPITLALPRYDILPSSQSQSTTAHLLRQGAACQLLFLGMVGVECLSGDEAIQRGIIEISAASPVPISLRLSRSGLTLTDVFRKQFFRIHFSLNEISYASVVSGRSVAYGREVKQVFGIVARAPRAHENSVILLAELEHGQPANAIVSFIQRVIAWQQH